MYPSGASMSKQNNIIKEKPLCKDKKQRSSATPKMARCVCVLCVGDAVSACERLTHCAWI